jgi:GMP synthase (glutamine-hydrolysing)
VEGRVDRLMVTPRTRLRIALIQLRTHRSSKMQEQSCFIERCRIARHRFNFINLVDTPNVRWRDIEDAHAVIIGGAGAFSVLDDDQPFTEPMVDLVREIIDRGRPLFGVCWGHQFLIKHTGGTVIEDPEQAEIGTYAAELTPEGRADPLFEECPSPFWIQLGHKDSARRLGPGWIELAYSERSRNQAVRLGDTPVYGTQFHTDLNEERLRERLHVYFDDYVEDEDDYERILRSLRPSIDADRLLERFLDLYA